MCQWKGDEMIYLKDKVKGFRIMHNIYFNVPICEGSKLSLLRSEIRFRKGRYLLKTSFDKDDNGFMCFSEYLDSEIDYFVTSGIEISYKELEELLHMGAIKTEREIDEKV